MLKNTQELQEAMIKLLPSPLNTLFRATKMEASKSVNTSGSTILNAQALHNLQLPEERVSKTLQISRKLLVQKICQLKTMDSLQEQSLQLF